MLPDYNNKQTNKQTNKQQTLAHCVSEMDLFITLVIYVTKATTIIKNNDVFFSHEIDLINFGVIN